MLTCFLYGSILQGLRCKRERQCFVQVSLSYYSSVKICNKAISFDSCSSRLSDTTYHLMVYLRLGWLTVLSSKKMVEQELYLRLKGAAVCFNTWTHRLDGSMSAGMPETLPKGLQGSPPGGLITSLSGAGSGSASCLRREEMGRSLQSLSSNHCVCKSAKGPLFRT